MFSMRHAATSVLVSASLLLACALSSARGQGLPVPQTAEEAKACPVHFDHHSTEHARNWAEDYRSLRERSPRASVMWPLCGQPLNRSTAKVSPDEPSVR